MTTTATLAPALPTVCQACAGTGTRTVAGVPRGGDYPCGTCGGHGQYMPQRGDTIRIPKGTRITGTFPGDPKTAGRSYTVTVFDSSAEYIGDAKFGKRESEVTWVGAGQYWHRAHLADVELVAVANAEALPTTPSSVVWTNGHPFVLDGETGVPSRRRWVGLDDHGTPVVLTPTEMKSRRWSLVYRDPGEA